MGRKNSKEYERVWFDFNQWKIKANVMIQLPTGIKYKDRKKLIEDLYIIKEEDSDEIILSGGTILWLYLGGTNRNVKVLDKLKKRKQWNLLLEEMKIRDRLNIFGINTNNLDKKKIEGLIK